MSAECFYCGKPAGENKKCIKCLNVICSGCMYARVKLGLICKYCAKKEMVSCFN